MFIHPRPKKSLLPPPAKRRKTTSAAEEINFDFSARANYLTGFHKRKVQRTKQAQEEALKKAREQRIAERKQLREERRQELEAHVEAVNAVLWEAKIPGANDDDEFEEEVWGGFQDDQIVEPVDHEAEYIDEGRYTTVTVEAVDVSREGLHKVSEEDNSEKNKIENQMDSVYAVKANSDATIKKLWPKKTRKKKFRYESKAERKVTRVKQRSGNHMKADARKNKY